MLLPAMRVGGPLVATEPASSRLVASLPKIQEVFRNFELCEPSYGQYQPVNIDVRRRRDGHSRQRRRVASFFTGGVDSFYTVARHRHEIEALVYVHGFDLDDNPQLDARVSGKIRAAAAGLGKPLIEVRTNLRSVTDKYAQWVDYHGSALASVALMLAPELDVVYVPATVTNANPEPNGSHPLLDPLWSTEDVELVHDGCEASRLDKLSMIAADPMARAHLHVCLWNREGQYNCGACEKCLRTMVCLRALGVLDAFETLPDTLNLAAIARVKLPEVPYTWEATLQHLKKSGVDPALTRALDHRLHSTRARLVHTGVQNVERTADLIQSLIKRLATRPSM